MNSPSVSGTGADPASVVTDRESSLDPAELVASILAQPEPSGWCPTEVDRSFYLDLMEVILNVAAGWQDERGAIIDPEKGVEHGQTSSRFVAPGAILLSAGRAEHLRPLVLRGMDWCCLRLSSGEAKSADFWMRELMTAWPLLQDAEPQRRARWADQIRSIDPEKIYHGISPDGSKLYELHNWTVYAAAGEALRQVHGLGPDPDDGSIIWGQRFFEKYMPAQMTHFSDRGMYRDPGDPLTYDMTTRLQMATPFVMGFKSPLHAALDVHLQRGALTQLLYTSPAGYMPYGGRSAQMNFQEAIGAAVCELEARRYRQHNPRLAAAFKRQARLHAISIRRWILDAQPMSHIKNGFDPRSGHGNDRYATWSVYSLFAASCLGLAWLFADDQIPEAPAPAEIGGYVLSLQPAFHKVFAVCGGTQIEVDTAADPKYDATGLGRFHRSGVPLELGLAMPFSAQPAYRLPEDLIPPGGVAIGPGWRIAEGPWVDLASLHEPLDIAVETVRATPDEVVVQIHWCDRVSRVRVMQYYQLTAGRLRIHVTVTPPQPKGAEVRMIVPMLQSNGSCQTRIIEKDNSVAVLHSQGVYRVEVTPGCQRSWMPAIANRNGIYRPLVLQRKSNDIDVTLTLDQP